MTDAQSHPYLWETGTSRPDMDNLTALARYFNVTLDWLITGQDPLPPEGGPVAQTVINNYYNEWHYEYKSRRTLFGLPLVHIHLGRGLQRAKGIIAIGNVATGVVALGVFAAGLVSAGCLTLGILTLGCVALGLVGLGCIAIGLLAIGGMALGVLSIRALVAGVWSIGGVAHAAQIAIGAVASGPLAIGDEVSGAVTLLTDGSVSRAQIADAIRQALGGVPLADFLTFMAAHIHSTPLQ